MEDHRGEQQDGAAHARVRDVRGQPALERHRHRGLHLVGCGAAKTRQRGGELGDGVRRALQRVARHREETRRAPVAGVDHRVVREAMHAQRPGDRRQRDGDAGVPRRVDAVIPGELAVPDVVSVAVPEVDPVAVRRPHAAAPAADRVGVLEHHDAFSVPCQDRGGHQARERGPHDHDVDDVGDVGSGTHVS